MTKSGTTREPKKYENVIRISYCMHVDVCLETWQRLGHRLQIARALKGLGSVAHEQGDAESARVLFEESLSRPTVSRRQSLSSSRSSIMLVGTSLLTRNPWKRSVSARRSMNFGMTGRSCRMPGKRTSRRNIEVGSKLSLLWSRAVSTAFLFQVQNVRRE